MNSQAKRRLTFLIDPSLYNRLVLQTDSLILRHQLADVRDKALAVDVIDDIGIIQLKLLVAPQIGNRHAAGNKAGCFDATEQRS